MEQIKSAIEELEFDMECGEFYNPSMADSVKLAIRYLQAWEKVLTKLEEREIEYTNNEFKPLADNMYYWRVRNLGIRDAINIINQHLADVPENNVGEIEK